ncbi:MAG: suppressor of fused domain protein [Actinomycetota bacterium]|nr:suppressor of fused domain protein [Actinomycetota bacterium]
MLGEIVPGDPPLTLYRYPSSSERRWSTLRTAGLSDRPMTVPENVVGRRYAELLLYLPAGWDLSGEGWWPARLLKELGRFPHVHSSWLGPNHTVALSEPGETCASGTQISGALLLAPEHERTGFDPVAVDGVACHFLWVLPVTEAEMNLKLQHGREALLALVEDAGLDRILDPGRGCLVTGHQHEDAQSGDFSRDVADEAARRPRSRRQSSPSSVADPLAERASRGRKHPLALREAPEQILADLTDRDEAVGDAAAMVLGGCGPEDREAVPALIEGLLHGNPAVRFWGVIALGRIGPDAVDAVPALIALLQNQASPVRMASARALVEIGSSAAEAAVPTLIHLMKTDDYWAGRIEYSSALRDLGVRSPELVDALVEALADPNEHVRAAAAIGLEHQGQLARPARPLLARMAADETETEHVRHQAGKAAKHLADS